MDDAIVLDSSAILALLYGEPGWEVVGGAVQSPVIEVLVSSVNLCEVVTKLAWKGWDAEEVRVSIEPILELVVGFDAAQSLAAAELSRATRRLGLSLGDRACLALAASRGATAWTTDAAWMKLEVGVKIHLLRG